MFICLRLSSTLDKRVEGRNRILHIDQVRFPGDSGRYSCIVDGNEGERVDVDLDVQQAFETILTGLPEKTEATTGEEMTFKVEVSAPEVQVQWLRDGVMLSRV